MDSDRKIRLTEAQYGALLALKVKMENRAREDAAKLKRKKIPDLRRKGAGQVFTSGG